MRSLTLDESCKKSGAPREWVLEKEVKGKVDGKEVSWRYGEFIYVGWPLVKERQLRVCVGGVNRGRGDPWLCFARLKHHNVKEKDSKFDKEFILASLKVVGVLFFFCLFVILLIRELLLDPRTGPTLILSRSAR